MDVTHKQNIPYTFLTLKKQYSCCSSVNPHRHNSSLSIGCPARNSLIDCKLFRLLPSVIVMSSHPLYTPNLSGSLVSSRKPTSPLPLLSVVVVMSIITIVPPEP